jgi:hypothetical protein
LGGRNNGTGVAFLGAPNRAILGLTFQPLPVHGLDADRGIEREPIPVACPIAASRPPPRAEESASREEPSTNGVGSTVGADGDGCSCGQDPLTPPEVLKTVIHGIPYADGYVCRVAAVSWFITVLVKTPLA